MVHGSQIRVWIQERSELQLNHPEIEEYWEKMTKALISESQEDVISFLESCSEEELGWISELVVDLCDHFNNKPFVNNLKKLDSKYPNADLGSQITWVEENMNII